MQQEQDVRYMKMALEEAQKAYDAGDTRRCCRCL